MCAMSEDEYTVTARDLLQRDEIGLIDVDGGDRHIAKVSGMSEGDVWLQYHDDGEPRAVAAHSDIRVRPAGP